jgi:putative phage-type endonuclease
MTLWPIGHAIPRPDWGRYLSPEWRETRRTGAYIGCSMVAAILNLSPWEGPWTAWKRLTGRAEPKEQTDRMLLGLDMEPVILKWWRRKRPEVVAHWRPQLTYQHPRVPCLGASLDAVGDLEGGGRVLAECKHPHWRVQEQIDEYLEQGIIGGELKATFVQVQAQMAVTGLPMTHLAIICGKGPTVINVPRWDAWTTRIEQEVPSFHALYVATDKEPPAGSADEGYLRTHYAKSDPSKVIERLELAADVAKAREVKARIAVAKAKAREIEKDELAPIRARLMQAMGDAEELHTGEGKPVTWRPDKNGKRSMRI